MAWDQTRNDIIKRALRILGVLAQGESPSAEQVFEGSEALNALIKSLGSEGIWLWKTEWIIKSLNASSVVIGTDALQYTCIRGHVSSASNCPITGSDYKMYWEQSGVGGAAWGAATTYSSLRDILLGEEIIDVLKVFVRDSDNHDNPVDLVSRFEFADIAQKNNTSNLPTVAWVEKLENPRLYLSQPASAVTDYSVHLYVHKVMNDIITASANPDMPNKYYDMLIYRLAANLADEYGTPLDERGYLMNKAMNLTQTCIVSNREDTCMQYCKPVY